MELNLNVDSTAINQYMAEKVLESALGDQIKKAIAEKFKEFDGYNSPLKGVVDQYIREAIMTHLQTTYKAQISAAIVKALTPEAIEKLAQDYVGKLKFNDRSY